MSPDFAFVHRDDVAAFAREAKAAVTRMFPNYSNCPDFTNVHLDRQRQYLAMMVKDADKRGAKFEVLEVTPIDQLASVKHFPPVIVVNPPLDAQVMREEVFGRLLPIIAYDSLPGAAEQLGKLARPLAMYFIRGTAAEKEFILKNTYAGGISFNDVMLHPFMQQVAFGGVGESGMGRCLGYDGFNTMLNAKGFAQRP